MSTIRSRIDASAWWARALSAASRTYSAATSCVGTGFSFFFLPVSGGLGIASESLGLPYFAMFVSSAEMN